MREPVHPATDDLRLTTVLHALSDPTRLEIVRTLGRDGECSCGRFDGLGPSASGLSHHFRVLREAGVTRTRIEGKRRFMDLRSEDLGRRFPGLLDAVLSTERV
jgi:DNA-binding transcriptional ArsR family regulator